MKEKENNQLENFVDHIMESAALESPSSDFTAKVMFQAVATKKSPVIVYKPLIPKSVFAAVMALFTAAFIFLPEPTAPPTIAWLPSLDFEPFYDLAALGVFAFSKTASYTAVLATLLLLVQIFILKKYFGKQFQNYHISS